MTLPEMISNDDREDQERPKNLQDLVEKEKLVETSVIKTSFTLDDLSDDDEVWVMEIPRTVDPTELKGQTIQLGDKSKFNIGDKRYCAVSRQDNSTIPCVYGTGTKENPCKAVNMKIKGSISIRRKLNNISKPIPPTEENYKVPFPRNLRTRHPHVCNPITHKPISSPRYKKKSPKKVSNDP